MPPAVPGEMLFRKPPRSTWASVPRSIDTHLFLSELKTQCLFAASGDVSVGHGGFSAGLGAMQSWSASRLFTWLSRLLFSGPMTRPLTKPESVMALQIEDA